MPTATATAIALPDTEPLRRKDKVVAAVDMPGIPAGTTGRVTMVSGFTWIRYWVRWDNGVVRGSINRDKLVRPGEPYGEELVELRAAAEAPAASADAGEVGDAPAAAGEGIMHGGVLVPAHLLERSRARRALLTGGG
jgi:hypothetical protein